MRTVIIQPKFKLKENNLKGLESMINNLCIVDPEIVKQYVKLLAKNQAESIITSHPELELAISNLPQKYQEMTRMVNLPNEKLEFDR